VTIAPAHELITYSQPSTGFGFFICTRRTAAHLDWTKQQLAKRHPGAILVIIQGCYNRAVAASEGTHDFDACLDIRIVGLDWPTAQGFIRSCGWGGWWRRPSQGPWDDHIHMISLGFTPYPIKVGKYVDGGVSLTGTKFTSSQVEDYFNEAWGMSGMHEPGSDPSWFPEDKIATIFDYEKWSDDMPSPKEWDAEDWKAIRANLPTVKEIAAGVWSYVVRKADPAKGITEQDAEAALKKAANR
jgi:hypothetical protein